MSDQKTELKAPIAHLVCDPCEKAIEFYQKAFGAEELQRVPGPNGEKIMHACLKIDDGYIFLVDDFPEFNPEGKSQSPKALGGSPVTIHRYVDNCDDAFKQAIDSGAMSKMEPQDTFWGDRYAAFVDPFGHNWSIAHRVKNVSNEDLTKAMNEEFSGEKC